MSANSSPRSAAPASARRERISFWESTGPAFPSLKGAPSTRYYFEGERLLFREFFPKLGGLSLLKTDLWDEAKNTEILVWAAEQGARPFGLDISLGLTRQARAALEGHDPGLVTADVRALPFAEGAFDLVYSMGTIEHFEEYEAAVREIHRVLKPGGRALVGVPNKLDPFLRPVLVFLLNKMGLYAYGREKSFTPGQLRRLLRSAGFRVRATSGLLFLPGWLRLLDLWFHTRVPALTRLTRALIRPFALVYQACPRLRRHGYLLAVLADKQPPAFQAKNRR